VVNARSRRCFEIRTFFAVLDQKNRTERYLASAFSAKAGRVDFYFVVDGIERQSCCPVLSFMTVAILLDDVGPSSWLMQYPLKEVASVELAKFSVASFFRLSRKISMILSLQGSGAAIKNCMTVVQRSEQHSCTCMWSTDATWLEH
jgi:hypothetical protein